VTGVEIEPVACHIGRAMDDVRGDSQIVIMKFNGPRRIRQNAPTVAAAVKIASDRFCSSHSSTPDWFRKSNTERSTAIHNLRANRPSEGRAYHPTMAGNPNPPSGKGKAHGLLCLLC
jgi:hypothetical protein